MEASKLTFSPETRAALNSPALSWKKKRELKIANIKAYIESKPVGTKFKLSDLGGVAGYRISDMKERQAAYAFVKQLGVSGVLKIEDTPKWKKLVTIPDSDKIQTRRLETPTNNHVPADEVVLGDEQDMELGKDIAFIIKIEKEARKFAWKENSDSLREFVKSLK